MTLALAESAAALCAMAFVRGLPLMVDACFARGLSRHFRFLTLTIYAAFCVALFNLSGAGFIGHVRSAFWLYLVLCGGTVAAFMLGLLVREGYAAKLPAGFAGAMFTLLLVLFVCPPHFRVAALVVALEFCLSSYSWVVDGSRSEGGRSAVECAHFLLVNPVLVYPERTVAKHVAGKKVAAQLALGATMLSVGTVGQRVLEGLDGAMTWSEPWSALELLSDALLLGTVVYCLHAGFANILVAWFAARRSPIPERYAYPVMSTSPAEFWRRWNTYLGSWVKRYVFAPIQLKLRRAGLNGAWSVTLSAVVAFLFIGLTHDFAAYFQHHSAALTFSMVFAVQGCLVLLSVSLLSLGRRFSSYGLVTSLANATLLVCAWLFMFGLGSA